MSKLFLLWHEFFVISNYKHILCREQKTKSRIKKPKNCVMKQRSATNCRGVIPVKKQTLSKHESKTGGRLTLRTKRQVETEGLKTIMKDKQTIRSGRVTISFVISSS